MNITKYKKSLIDELKIAEAELTRKQDILTKIQESSTDDYMTQYALEEGDQEAILEDKTSINKISFLLINTKITHLSLIISRYNNRQHGRLVNYRKMKSRLEQLKDELKLNLLEERDISKKKNQLRYRGWTLE